MKLSTPINHQRASVLIIVLWIALGLVAITLYFGNSMGSELRASDNRVAMLAAEQAIEGAARYVGNMLTNQATNGVIPYLNDYISEEGSIGGANDDEANAHFWLIGRANAEDSRNEVTFGVIDEGSKLNINNPEVTLEMLELLPGMTTEFAAAIIDWRDTDEEISPGGAENETYARLQPAYSCKNAPFDSVDELRLVNGATLQLLLGEDLNRNGVLDPNEVDEDRDGIADPGLLGYVTVSSREPNTRADGSPRVNVNNAAELRILLEDTFGGRANQILQNVQGRQFGSLLEFYVASRMTEAEFMQIEADITTSPGATIDGRVNVNTASAAVLTCIPGIGEDKAIELVNYRQGNTETVNSVAWVRNVLSEEQMREAGPFLTGQTYVFSADIAALGPYGRGYRRARFVYDLTEGTAKIVYRQGLSHLGWALGVETRRNWLAKATP
ncbi:MAG TPA: helix-hairpin-helix domain-containing protein [Verrucomicrobiae bacterium]|nr:helix-hairpin-helix domain-containing protein [Verrucomicrobiae bacterium]